MLKRWAKSRTARQALAWLLGLYLWATLRTTRWTLVGGEHLLPYSAGAGCVLAVWHERLPVIPGLARFVQDQPGGSASIGRTHVLVSQHNDGRLIGLVLRWFRLRVLHGSSSRGGSAALRLMLALLAEGGVVVITPDGPRGPRRQAAPGVAQLAALAEVPVLAISAQASRRWVLGSWDRMVIPRPFGRGAVVVTAPIHVPRDGWQGSLPAIAAAMTEAADAADRLCG